ncbi:hypothetical protein VNI00_009873 [Paramarasmius palmivorus]|uniref:Uncharacterized protein n=1 Tax=Paramarasmius palmivorus TaxID=297713 RepID=A0AAW0CP84_9AGAR
MGRTVPRERDASNTDIEDDDIAYIASFFNGFPGVINTLRSLAKPSAEPAQTNVEKGLVEKSHLGTTAEEDRDNDELVYPEDFAHQVEKSDEESIHEAHAVEEEDDYLDDVSGSENTKFKTSATTAPHIFGNEFFPMSPNPFDKRWKTKRRSIWEDDGENIHIQLQVVEPSGSAYESTLRSSSSSLNTDLHLGPTIEAVSWPPSLDAPIFVNPFDKSTSIMYMGEQPTMDRTGYRAWHYPEARRRTAFVKANEGIVSSVPTPIACRALLTSNSREELSSSAPRGAVETLVHPFAAMML